MSEEVSREEIERKAQAIRDRLRGRKGASASVSSPVRENGAVDENAVSQSQARDRHSTTAARDAANNDGDDVLRKAKMIHSKVKGDQSKQEVDAEVLRVAGLFKNPPIDIRHPGRRLLREGDIKRKDRHGRLQKRYLFVFNDVAVVAKMKGAKSAIMKQHIPLGTAFIDDKDQYNTPSSFRIVTPDRNFVFSCSDNNMKSIWLTALFTVAHKFQSSPKKSADSKKMEQHYEEFGPEESLLNPKDKEDGGDNHEHEHDASQQSSARKSSADEKEDDAAAEGGEDSAAVVAAAAAGTAVAAATGTDSEDKKKKAESDAAVTTPGDTKDEDDDDSKMEADTANGDEKEQDRKEDDMKHGSGEVEMDGMDEEDGRAVHGHDDDDDEDDEDEVIPENVSYNGFLEKLGGNIKNWKRRFFSIDNRKLMYYVDEEAQTARGIIELPGAEIRPLSRDEHDRDHAFGVTPMNSSREYVLVADSDESRATWIRYLKQCSTNATKPEISVDILNPRVIDIHGHQIAVYPIRVQTKSDSWTITKRFNQFYHLNETLASIVPQLPAIPPKTFFRDNSGPFLEKRRQQLEHFLRVMLHNRQAVDHALKQFLGITRPNDRDDKQKQRNGSGGFDANDQNQNLNSSLLTE